LVVPKSIPMTEPFTFPSASSAYPRTNEEPYVERIAGARRTADVARGRIYALMLVDEVHGDGVAERAQGNLRNAITSRTAL
jgi:hypothetical protein